MIAGVAHSLPDRTVMVLRLIASAEGVDLDEALSRAVVHYGASVVGLQGLADAARQSERFQPGYDSLGARTTAATQSRPLRDNSSIPPEQTAGGGGNPAAPAGGCGPP